MSEDAALQTFKFHLVFHKEMVKNHSLLNALAAYHFSKILERPEQTVFSKMKIPTPVNCFSLLYLLSSLLFSLSFSNFITSSVL